MGRPNSRHGTINLVIVITNVLFGIILILAGILLLRAIIYPYGLPLGTFFLLPGIALLFLGYLAFNKKSYNAKITWLSAIIIGLMICLFLYVFYLAVNI